MKAKSSLLCSCFQKQYRPFCFSLLSFICQSNDPLERKNKNSPESNRIFSTSFQCFSEKTSSRPNFLLSSIRPQTFSCFYSLVDVSEDVACKNSSFFSIRCALFFSTSPFLHCDQSKRFLAIFSSQGDPHVILFSDFSYLFLFLFHSFFFPTFSPIPPSNVDQKRKKVKT